MSRGLERLVQVWRAAEGRLYPLLTHRPEAYERHLAAVRAVADELRSERTPESLARAWPESAEIAVRALRRSGMGPREMDLELVAACAFSLRYREVVAEARRDQASRRIRQARERGEEWAVVDESGRIGEGELLSLEPYRRLEVHLPDGAGLHAFVEPDAESGRPIYGFEIVKLDPSSGAWVEEARERRTFTDPSRWRDEMAKARRRLSTSPP